RWVHKVRWLGPRFYSAGAKAHIPWLITLPIGFGTGMLAATIAVGGFIGVPAMHYVLGLPSMMASATELVIAFVMGLGGTIKYGWSGYVDVRLAMIILAGSLFGIQLGAIGTTYVKPYMVKVVMGVIMMLVLFSRAFIIPVYLSELGWIEAIEAGTAVILKQISFWIMVSALVGGAVIVLSALISGMRDHSRAKSYA
ncbi:MAG: sulfite exporter TauE/SafE family protein, partial [Hylemonella sp.]|nr:sulfite exporter TauE/SafE family protein [Hylemonella sp.]